MTSPLLAPRYLASNDSELVLTTPGFDDLPLIGTTVDPDGYEFSIKALGADATWDNPQPIDVTVQRWLTDGAVASTQGHDNRSPYFKVVVYGGTSVDLAAGERALAQRAERIQRGEQIALLTWISAEGRAVAPAAVFEVWTWHLEHIFDGESEGRLARMYGIRATAKPWVRSEDLTEVDALVIPSVTPTIVPIDTCTSTSGWVGSPNTPTVVGGTSIQETATRPTTGGLNLSLTRAATVSGMGALRYLAIDMTTSGNGPSTITVAINSTTGLQKAAQIGTVSYWQLASGANLPASFSNIVIKDSGYVQNAPGSITMKINDVSATDTIGGVGSTKQLTRTLDVGGSVPTSGSLEVASPSSTPLGVVLVYTTPDTGSDYSPTMRQNRTSGNTVTPDSAAVSANHESLVASGVSAGTVTFTVPAAQYVEATYAVIGRFFSDSITTLTATVTAALTGYTGDPVSGKVVFTSVNTWQWGVIGALTLPPQAVPSASAVNMVVSLVGTGGGNISYDELYLLDITHGAVSLIACGVAATRLWLNAPDADPVRNRPTVYIGTLDDYSDAVNAPYNQILALGEHDLPPEGALLLTVTDGVGSALASASFYQRWHTQPAA